MKTITHDELLNHYDTFILDQWGVLHNGKKPYDGVLAFMQELRETNKKVMILSNSGKPASINKKRVDALGITDDLYDLFMSSGEAVKLGLEKKDAMPFNTMGHKAYLISRGEDISILGESDTEIVSDIGDADFILLSGLTEGKLKKEDYFPLFEKALTRKLIMLCANPDLWAIQPDGLYMAAGALALEYQKQGGEVYFYGKPHAEIYEYCHHVMPFDKSRAIMVGDSLHHDILGAQNFGIDSLLIGAGVLSETVDLTAPIENQLLSVKNVCEKEGITPTFYRPFL